MNDKKSTKSLYLYTALIFLVALLMIILSFFGQNNADKLKETEQKAQSITQRASALSEENLRLTQEISRLEEENNNLTTQLQEQTAAFEALTIQTNNERVVLTAFDEYLSRRYKSAVEMVKDVDAEALTSEVKRLYDIIMTKA